jgi:hypothetical protein
MIKVDALDHNGTETSMKLKETLENHLHVWAMRSFFTVDFVVHYEGYEPIRIKRLERPKFK